ncbi:MAG: hypothetical protein ABSG31_01630 [Tepidisphaeraceae bacterium]|jgi:hypothetical protein
MDADLFVEMVDKLAFESAVSSTLKNMTSPPGSRPSAELLELSRWFNELSNEAKKMVEHAISLSAAHAVTGFLSIIDGARAIESGPDKGRLELLYVKRETRVLLNDRHREPLNDKFHWQW